MPSKATTKKKPWLTVREVAELLQLSTANIVRKCSLGAFDGAWRTGSVGAPWRIPPEAVDRFIREQQEKARRAAPRRAR